MRALAELSSAWIAIQRSHNIWRVISAILDATGEEADSAAFINILPFRTRMDAAAPAAVLQRAWARPTEPQIAALRPRRVIALGGKAWNVLRRHNVPAGEPILFKRGIGDSYIPEESKAVLADLRRDRAG